MFTLKIKLGNDAMQDRDDVARAIQALADRLLEGSCTEGRIRDENGNDVGSWKLVGGKAAGI